MSYRGGLFGGFMDAERLGQTDARRQQTLIRTAQMPQQFVDRHQMHLQNMQLHQARIKQMQQLSSFRQASFAQRLAMFQQRMTNAQNNQYLKGLPFDTRQDTGAKGKGSWRMPTGAESTSLEKVIDAWPQLADAMNQIQAGASLYSTDPGKLKKYFDATAASLLGKANDKQAETLEKAGVSSNAIIQAGETAMRVMQVGRTNEGMRTAFGLFEPHKGQTPEVFHAIQQKVFDNFKKRFLQAQYQSKGVPLDDIGNSDMQDYLKKHMNDAASLNLNPMPKSITEEEIQSGMKTRPDLSRKTIIHILRKARAENASE